MIDTTIQTKQQLNVSQSEDFKPINNPAFRRIGLMGRAGKKSVARTIVQISQMIQRHDLQVIIDDFTAGLPNLDNNDLGNVETVKREFLGKYCDLVVVVGGDGSILHATEVLARYGVPVLGVNRGRLGFLADVSPHEVIRQLRQILLGDYQLDYRFLLSMQIRNGNNIIHQDMALNDVVLHAGKSVHMIDFQLQIDGTNVARQHSDGLIVATPTGSTAYALSGGGPIIHPNLDTICLVPLNPHTLSSRPIVVSGESEIMLHIHPDNRTQPMVSADGRDGVPIGQDERLYIGKHPDKLTLIHPPGFDFYEACRTKLYWNVHEQFSLEDEDDN